MIERIISFHNGNLNPELLSSQLAVFKHLGYSLEQIETQRQHAEAIDHFLATEKWDIVALFDADCIPLKPYLDTMILRQQLYGEFTLYGSAQRSSHIKLSRNFVAPSFMIITRKLWERTGKFSFIPTETGDVAERFSRRVEDCGMKLDMLMPTHVENPEWELDEGIKFGHGTTYDGWIYHAFESNANHHSTSRFIDKCGEVLRTQF